MSIRQPVSLFLIVSFYMRIHELQSDSQLQSNPFDTFLYGNSTCYLTLGYYPMDKFAEILHESMSIPNSSMMNEYYPETVAVSGMHPFILSFCHSTNIYSIRKGPSGPIPIQEEVSFIFPVMYNKYNNETGTKQSHLCSYYPVLYLNSSTGVEGGLYYGMRKEYRPEMKIVANKTSKSWYIKDTVNGSFVTDTKEKQTSITMPNFIIQSYQNPFVSISYPPLERTVFFQTRVYVDAVMNATGIFEWEYKDDVVIVNNNLSWSVWSPYWFSLSSPMDYTKYFGHG